MVWGQLKVPPQWDLLGTQSCFLPPGQSWAMAVSSRSWRQAWLRGLLTPSTP